MNHYTRAFGDALIERLDCKKPKHWSEHLPGLLDAAANEYLKASPATAAEQRRQAKRIERAARKLLEELGSQPIPTLVAVCAGFEIMNHGGAAALERAHSLHGSDVDRKAVSDAIERGCEDAATIFTSVQNLAVKAGAHSGFAVMKEFQEGVYGGGNTALKQWIARLCGLYEVLAGKKATVSIDPSSPTREVGGKFIEFARSAIRQVLTEDELPTASLDKFIERGVQ